MFQLIFTRFNQDRGKLFHYQVTRSLHVRYINFVSEYISIKYMYVHLATSPEPSATSSWGGGLCWLAANKYMYILETENSEVNRIKTLQ